MHINLPFTYTVLHRPNGGDKTSKTSAAGMVSSEVPELSRDDVVLAARWQVNMTPREIVYWDGNLYRPANPHEEPVVDRAAFEDLGWPLAHPAHMASATRIFGFPDWWSNSGKVLKSALGGKDKRLRIPDKSEIASTTFDADQAVAQGIADGLLLIDQVLWHRIPGVIFSLSESLDDVRPNLFISAPPYGHYKQSILIGMGGTQNPTVSRYFSLDEIDAVAHHTAETRADFADLEIFIPEATAYDGEGEFTARIMNSAVRNSAYRAGEMDDHEIGLWLKMREAVAGWYGSPSARIETSATEALFEFTAMNKHNDPAGWLRNGCKVIELYRDTRPQTFASSRPALR
jgi:hypothetical protein|nr:hypothetical protein [Neorhizobium tomejilense]